MENEGAKIPVAILVRVSTVKQETARQISELQTYAAAKGYEVIEVCRETISGQADEHERHGLICAEELARSGKVKKVLVDEISRLARKNSVAHRFVESLEECKVARMLRHSSAPELQHVSRGRGGHVKAGFGVLCEVRSESGA